MPAQPDDFMPAASIVKKLEALDANALYDVTKRAAGMTCRRHDESSKLSKLFAESCKRGWEKFQINMITYAGPYTISAAPDEAYAMQKAAIEKQKEDVSIRFWMGRGDDMRLGILDYMSAKNLTPKAVGLDKAECDSLELLRPKDAPRPHTPQHPKPIIWFMP